MKILINTVRGDEHSVAVAAVLKRLGAEVAFSVGPDIPLRQTLSVRSDLPDHFSILREDKQVHASDNIDIIWLRRSKMFTMPDLHEDDVAHAKIEFEKFIFGFWDSCFKNAQWINAWRSRFFAENKVIQCAAARDVGFKLAPTLFSNDPEVINAFIAEYGADHVIYKSHNVIVWHESEIAVSTIRVSEIDLSDPESMRNCPGIYQGFVRKKRELRITAMGKSLHAVVIVTTIPENGDSDWRNHGNDLNLIPCLVPVHLAEQCHALMQKLGLLFGCFDIIEGLDGEYYFLEVNQMGQFLWIEQINPQLTYLDHFIDFLYEVAGEERPLGAPFKLAEIVASPEYAALMERLATTETVS